MLDDLWLYLSDRETRDLIFMIAGSSSAVGVVLMLIRSIRRMRRRQEATRDRRLSHLRGH